MLKRGYPRIILTSSIRVCISTPEWLEAKMSGGNEHDRCGAGEERYAALCAGYESNERNGTWCLKTSRCTI